MIHESTEFLILGSGFAGSLTALLLQRLGRAVVLADRASHPRFAIGESSTPLADLMLERLTRQYGVERLKPLTRYGSWKRTVPQVVCGLKRGFSYFRHYPERHFHTDKTHSNELLLAANADDEHGDTHWLRSDVDSYFVDEAVRVGIPFHDRLELRPVARGPWVWSGERQGERASIQAKFVIDATGPAGVVAQAAGARPRTKCLRTRSRSVFAHVRGLKTWAACLDARGVDCREHPFACDAAAVHHVLDEGWMWQLRFDNGVTSAGFVLEDLELHGDRHLEWRTLLSRYPSLQDQFADAQIVAPEDGLRQSPRLQRLWWPICGSDWALLPSAAGFIDPLHSTGIAHSLFGVERLVETVVPHLHSAKGAWRSSATAGCSAARRF